MISRVLRVCRTCGDRRHVAISTSAERGQIIRGGRQCLNCHAQTRRRPLIGPPPDRTPDSVVVARLLAGTPVSSMIDDRIEATRRLVDKSAAEIAAMLGVSARTVVRYRQEIRA